MRVSKGKIILTKDEYDRIWTKNLTHVDSEWLGKSLLGESICPAQVYFEDNENIRRILGITQGQDNSSPSVT